MFKQMGFALFTLVLCLGPVQAQESPPNGKAPPKAETRPAPEPRQAPGNQEGQGPKRNPTKPADAEVKPNQNGKQQIVGLIQSWKKQNKVATLGLIRDLVDLAVKQGGGLYDKGDVAGCYRMYAELVQILVKNFAANDQSSSHARNAMVDLVAAFKRAEQTVQVKFKAWRLRFAFDKVLIDYAQAAAYMQRFNQLGQKYCRLGQYGDSMIAYNLAAQLQQEIMVNNPARMPISQRNTGIAMSRALLGAGEFKKASRALQENMRFLPEWPTFAFRPFGAFQSVKAYESIIQKVAKLVQNNPKADADLVFLLAHELFFLGQADQALNLFQQLKNVSPNHFGARCFLELAAGSARHTRIAAALKMFLSQNPMDRQTATSLLEKEGRWCLPFLRSLVTNQKIPEELRQRAKNLLKAMGE
jgi:tetratricopeptide (TPR) repeat protein